MDLKSWDLSYKDPKIGIPEFFETPKIGAPYFAQENMVELMSQAMQKLRALRGGEDFDSFSNKFLDNFLLNLGCC